MECPVCYDHFTIPVYQCANGHSFCAKCYPRLIRCATCNGHVNGTRNYALEDILETLKFPCENSDAGCKVVLSPSELREHAPTCSYRKYQCDVCGLFGYRKNELRDHVKYNHSHGYNENNFVHLTDSPEAEVTGCYIWTYDELFLVQRLIRNDIAYVMAYNLGTTEHASNYSCEIKLLVAPDKEIKFQLPCCKDTCTIDDIINGGLSLAVALPVVQSFSDENDEVCWYIHIYRRGVL